MRRAAVAGNGATRALRGVVAQAIEPQFLAALDMLERAIRACPDRLWAKRGARPQFWYVAYHTLFFTDFYLLGEAKGFAPPAPFGLEEMDPRGVMPPRVYTKAELLGYVAHCRRRARAVFDTLTPARAAARCRYGWGEKRFLELLVHNHRHVQHHVGQLHLMLRLGKARIPRWVFGTAPSRPV